MFGCMCVCGICVVCDLYKSGMCGVGSTKSGVCVCGNV